ncbi:MAG: hypothetical protein UHG91_02305 [Succinivibrionaceae bacterium]|nr:hypothetical protein [Ruminobacter sp.]MDY5778476.1 hypothetical protein [Succinivibrionaceae bacterium]MEE1339600.1 hypothetical protein [Succinivibrionaceae bacterium]
MKLIKFLSILAIYSLGAVNVWAANDQMFSKPIEEVENNMLIIISDLKHQYIQNDDKSQIFVDDITYDKKEKLVVYKLKMKTNQDPQEVFEFFENISKDFLQMDCNNKNFINFQIGNRYELRDINGSVVGRKDTKYDMCNRKGELLYRK